MGERIQTSQESSNRGELVRRVDNAHTRKVTRAEGNIYGCDRSVMPNFEFLTQ
jgi:hypothetical protein